MSSMLLPWIGRPWKNRRRRNTGCSARSFATSPVNSVSTEYSRAAFQSTQLVSLSWQ
jgi:hypothetical protein